MERVYIIAEAGVNHNGSLETAIKLADAAKAAGADAVKFQTFRAEKVASPAAVMADYQQRNIGIGGSQVDMLEKLELPFEAFARLKAHCDQIGITFLSTAFDEESLDFLEELNLPALKIPSGEVTNLPLLLRLARTGKPLLLSTGMCTLEEVQTAVKALHRADSGKICLLHCTTAYPTPPEEVNLRAMVTMKEQLGLPVGYSDHTEGLEVPVAATALGARVIEKHFTLNKSMAGPDHKASATPEEFAAMVRAVRLVKNTLGNGVKTPTETELRTRPLVRRRIVAAQHIAKGDTFTEENLTVKRPANGISPMEWFSLLGQTATREYSPEEPIRWGWGDTHG